MAGQKLSRNERLRRNWLRRKLKQLRAKGQTLHWQDYEELQRLNEVRKASSMLKQDIKIKQQAQEDALKLWIKSNDTNIDVKYLKALWEDSSQKYRDKLIRLAIINLAATEGANQANEAFAYALDMPEVQIDLEELGALGKKMFKLQVMKLLIQQSRVPYVLRRELMARVVAREFPLKDNRNLTKQASGIDSDNRAVERALSREVRALTGDRMRKG